MTTLPNGKPIDMVMLEAAMEDSNILNRYYLNTLTGEVLFFSDYDRLPGESEREEEIEGSDHFLPIERISSSEQHYIDLDRAIHFDKLGVNQSLLQLQITWERKRLVAPQQFLPLLDRVIKNESFLHMARERAATLADAFRNIKSAQVQTP